MLGVDWPARLARKGKEGDSYFFFIEVMVTSLRIVEP